MTQPKSAADKAAGQLGATAKSYLRELHLSTKYNRIKEYSNKYIEKGLKGEEDAITLLTLNKKVFLKKNKERLNNEFLTGEPDVYLGDDILKAEEGFDTKCSWDLWTFPDPLEALDPMYEWQNHGYMALTGAKRWTTAYGLINATPELIMSEIKKVYYALDCPGDDNPIYIQKCIEIEKNMIFDMATFKKSYPGYDLVCKDWVYDIPKEERMILFPVERDEAKITAIYEQVKKCRSHMNTTFLGASTVIDSTQSIVKRAS